MPTRKEFERMLEEQGYKIEDTDTYFSDTKYFVQELGCYILRVVVSDKGDSSWAINCGFVADGLFDHSDLRGIAIAVGDKTGKTYDVAEFNKAQHEIVRDLQQRVIPALTARIQLPKELEALLEK